MKNSNKLLKIKDLKTLPQIGSRDKMNGNNVTFFTFRWEFPVFNTTSEN